VKRKAWIAFAIVTLLTWTQGIIAAQDSGPVMQATVGFDSYCRRGDWCPIYAVLSNEGADVEGELRIAVSGGSGTDPDLYATRVVLPAHSRKAYTLYLPPAGLSVRSDFMVRLLAGDKVLSAEEVVVTRLDREDRLYGVASSSPSALNFLSDVAPVGGTAKVAHLDLETLPPDPLGWEGLDVLILSDVDTTVFSGEQRRALETWVAHGGHLIVGGGAGAARTVAGVADLLPVAVGGTRSVNHLWALGQRSGAPVATGPYAVAEAALRDGVVLIEQDDLILLARRVYGAGRVDYLAFDPDLNPFLHWDGNVRLWEEIVGPWTVGARGLTVHNEYNARDAINAIPGLQLPSILEIIAFLLAYTLLIGPINYVILRKFDKRELAWLTIPVLILGFTICAYVTGFRVRGGKVIVHRLAVVYVPEGAGVGRVSQVVGIFSPRRTKYDVWVADAEVRQIQGDHYSRPERQPLHIFKESEGATIADLRVDVGGIQPFIADGYTDVQTIEANLWLAEEGTGGLWLRGTVRNGDMPLNDAVLIAGDGEQRLDDLEAGEEASIRLRLRVGGAVTPTPVPVYPAPVYYGQYDMPERILGPGDYWSDRTLRRRYQFLQAIFNPSGSYGPGGVSGGSRAGLGPGVHLVGWAEEECPLSVEVIDGNYSSVETALYIYTLPVADLGMDVAATVPPSLITREVVVTTGYVDVGGEGLHMEPESRVTFRFTVWPGAMVRRVDELVLSIRSGGSSYEEGRPTVLLWNWESGEWEEVDVHWGQHSIPGAGAYVTPSGSVLLRLEASEVWSAEIESLTITIKGQR
jgi:hypothetical protein